MNKIRVRSYSVLLLVAIALLGMLFLLIRFFVFGAQWATARERFNETVFRNGRFIATGTVTDRNGVILADVTDGRRTYAENANVRRSTVHAVGDLNANISTGALTAFATDLTSYNLITGSFGITGPGREVVLTIDSRLNVVALNALGDRRGAVMVSNYKTGEILCMVSTPAFDPTNPPDNPSDKEAPFYNRAIQSAYPPGSTFKLVTAAAAIDNIDNVYDLVFTCTREAQIGNDALICHGSHGTLGIERGMEVSCNIVYGELAIALGPDIMAEYSERFGLSTRTSVNGIPTARGNFDETEPGSIFLAWSGIGQHTNQICPASMLRFVSAIANEGNAIDLHFKQRTGLSSIFSPRTRRIIDKETAISLGDLIKINNRQNFPGLELYAKTGTAQDGVRAPHAWYVGYITNEDFPLAFVVVVENSGSGREIASPIANSVLQEAISG